MMAPGALGKCAAFPFDGVQNNGAGLILNRFGI